MPVKFPTVRKENAVNPGIGGLTRWAPRVRPGRPRRRRGRGRGVRGRTRPRRVGVPGWSITLVARVNNFWGLLHRGGRLIASASAGGSPGVPKAGPTAASRVATHVGGAYSVRTDPTRRVGPFFRWGRRRWVGLRPGEPRRRNPPRWRRRPTRVAPVVVCLVGWSRDRRWKFAWNSLGLTGRVRVDSHPVRGHNGLRGKKPRRT